MTKPTKYELPEQTLLELNLGIQQIKQVPKRGNNYMYNEIECSLACLEVLNSKITQILSHWNANRGIIFLIMYILHFNWLKSYMYGNTQRKKNKDATLLTSYFLSF